MKLKIYFAAMVVLLLITAGCKDKGTNPPVEEKPAGYQEDIPWPSLADSPWPMNHHDPQSTGRSQYSGPRTGIIDWVRDSTYMKSGISIGPDSTIYFVSIDKKGLFALHPDGSVKWKIEDIVDNGYIVTTPLIASDGTIYIGGGLNGNLYAINSKGTIKWKTETLGFILNVGLNIDLDGNIYLLNGDQSSIPKLVVVSPTGQIIWYLENTNFDYGTSAGLAFSPDGKTIYVPGINPSIFAIDISSHNIKWTFGQTRFQTTPTIDSQGHIYLLSRVDTLNNGQDALYCLNNDGSINWSFIHGSNYPDDHTPFLEGTIDNLGNYYFALDTLYCLNYEGKLMWKFNLQGTSFGSVTCDINSNIFLNIATTNKFIAVNKSGKLIWEFDMGNQFSGHSPAIGANHSIYVPTFKSDKIFSIK